MDNHIKLDDYGNDYEPTDSEDDYSEEEKELLKNYRESRRKDVDQKTQVLAFADSSDEEEEEGAAASDENDDLMHDSDIEGAERHDDDDSANEKNWGGKARNYYNADFVDPDYNSYTAKEEELAELEEEEARAIQKRLLKAMKEDDFMLNEQLAKVDSTLADDAAADEIIKIQTNLTDMPLSEKDKLFKKDSPEFVGLILDFKELLQDVRMLLTPVLRYIKKQQMPKIPALQFAELYQNIALTYCSNISFYLLLKAKRIPIRNHPVTKRLLQLKKLLQQLKDKYENIIKPQLEALLERIEDGDKFELLEITAKPIKKSKLAVLADYEDNAQAKNKHIKLAVNDDEDDANSSGSDSSDDMNIDDAAEADNAESANEKRGITYQIAKNKGLMPHRKKELRNPRVKHRSKFRKALIRRKGAVRTVRKETKRYGGEMSGIKAGVSKSVKFKV